MLDPNDYSSPMELTDSSLPVPAVEKPAVDPAPSDPVEPATKIEDKPADPPAGDDPPADPAVVLYDLPDGRKVDAATLQKEWKENFLPEFTRKSQRLADFENPKDIKDASEEPKWKKADYVPENYAEVIQLAKDEALRELKAEGDAEAARVKAIHDGVEAELLEVKKLDPKLDADALFNHANKFGFSDLKAAYTNMTEMKKVALEAEQRTLKNIKARDVDPIAGGTGGATSLDDAYDPVEMSGYGSAQDYLARIKRGK